MRKLKKAHDSGLFGDLAGMVPNSIGRNDLLAGALLGVAGLGGVNLINSKLGGPGGLLPDALKAYKPLLGGVLGAAVGYILAMVVKKKIRLDPAEVAMSAVVAGAVVQVAKMAADHDATKDYFALSDLIQLKLDGYGNVIVNDPNLPVGVGGIVLPDSQLNGYVGRSGSMSDLVALAAQDD